MNANVSTGPAKSAPGLISRMRGLLPWGKKAGVGSEAADSPFLFRSDRVVGERYRTLAWMMDQLRQKQTYQVITVTSSVASEGKSTVALNLAAVLSERASHRVLLVDCDMRRPRLWDILGGEAPGLVELLEGRCDFGAALHRSDEVAFTYIPVITPLEEPLQLLTTGPGLEQLVAAAREQFDYIILDAPPVLPVSDPLFLSEASDAVLFVVRAGETSGRMLSRSLSVLKKDKLLGIVFNGTSRGMGYRYDPYYKKNKYHQKRTERSYR